MLEFGAALPRIRKRVKADLALPIGAAPRRETGARDPGPAPRHDAGPRRQRRIRAHQPLVRPDDAAQPPRRRQGQPDPPQVPRQERHRARGRPRRSARRPRRPPLPGDARARTCSSTRTRRAAIRAVGSADVNDYIRDAAGADFTAKDFRTWHGSVHALALWAEQCAADAACRRSANQLLAEVAHRLGNTVAVCKKSYVHPRVLETLATQVDSAALARLDARRRAGLDVAERRLLAFLGHG
jgi:DNA topoisomerase-1